VDGPVSPLPVLPFTRTSSAVSAVAILLDRPRLFPLDRAAFSVALRDRVGRGRAGWHGRRPASTSRNRGSLLPTGQADTGRHRPRSPGAYHEIRDGRPD